MSAVKIGVERVVGILGLVVDGDLKQYKVISRLRKHQVNIWCFFELLTFTK